jgi:threonylcarbamoyladenosine tRNA methylthiotransferase MtaB
MTTFAQHTLGCKVNQQDGEALAERLAQAGYVRIPFNAKTPAADIYIINTCTVTHTVDKKAMQYIRRAKRTNPQAFIAVCGCMAKGSNTITEADVVFDTRIPEDLLTALAERFTNHIPSHPTPYTAARTRAVLKVQDGCDNFCAYCIVPYVRGPLTSLPAGEAVRRAQALVQNGTKEIVLTGIQLAAYGKDNSVSGDTLNNLIRRITEVPNLHRLRLSSLEPRAIDTAFINTIKNTPNLCGHFHLSLQSGCNATLARMNRRYTTAQYKEKAQQLRQLYPQAALTTDIIVGFPGETEEDFSESLAFVTEIQFARVHVFPYSPRAGTAAATMPNQVPEPVKKARTAQMLTLAARLYTDFLHSQHNRIHEVLFETPHTGHTRNYCPVRTTTKTTPNEIHQIKITGFCAEALTGVIA